MNTCRAIICLLLFSVMITCGYASDVNKGINLIEIRGRWGGLGTPQSAVVTIKRTKKGFVCNGKRVNEALVQALVTTLSALPITKPDMTNLGITREWLMAHAATHKPRLWAQFTETTANQKQMFNRSFTDPSVIEKVSPSLFRYTKFDDYPSSQVEVLFEDGSKLVAETHSYYIFMLPWKIEGQNGETYNAEISRAVSALLPSKTVNKTRLGGDDLSSELTEAVMRLIKRDWNLLGSDEHAGDALRSLRTAYEVVTAEINPYHHPEYGNATYKNLGERGEMNLHISLHKPTFPANVTDAVVLRYENEKVEGVDDFLKSAGKYEELALSVPWLKSYINEHPRVEIRISYVKNLSFGEKAMRVFAADMKIRGRDDLIDQVKAQQSDIALLIIGNTYSESYWLVFPDKHMLLWRYGGASGLLKWTREYFGKGQCSEYENNDGGCSGREITPDGTLADKHVPHDQECMVKNRTTQMNPAPTGDELFPVMDHGKGGFIDRSGKIIIPLCFDKVGDFSEGLARFERDGNWGYIDTTGTVIIEPRFPWAKEFSEGLAKVQVLGSTLGFDARWGFINKTGEIVIPPNYGEGNSGHSNIGSDSSETSFHDGLARVEINGKTGFIDKTGKLVILAKFTYAYPFAEGLASITESPSGDNGWGYIDTAGKFIVEPQFQWGSSFSDGLAPVKLNQKCGYINRTGTIVLQPPFTAGEKDCATVWGDFSEGLSRWKIGKKYGFIDRTGEIVIEPKFDLADHFSEGLAIVRISKKWGYINRTGKMVIELNRKFHGEDFHHGLAFGRTEDGDYGYIDKSGKYVWTPTPLYIN
jgi:hypothetical protein